jgi:uncharacterized protein YutE (UPF0331/DUF86 family)
MSELNREYLLEQFGLIEEYLQRARRNAALSQEEYLSDPTAIDASIRQLTVLFETSHNIAKHLSSRLGWRPSSSKAETFEILAEQGILPTDLCDSFREASRFRNLVTYQTAMVKEALVYKILQDHLGDFERFMALVARWLATLEGE